LIAVLTKGNMPPKDADEKPLSDDQVSLLSRWIRLGLPADEQVVEVDPASLIRDQDRKFWAFQKLARHKSTRSQRSRPCQDADRCFRTGEAGGEAFDDGA